MHKSCLDCFGMHCYTQSRTCQQQIVQMSNFFDRLKEERERLAFSQEAMGALGGVRKQAQHLYEAGTRKPDSDYLESIAKHGADVLYILTGRRSLALPAEALLPPDERLLVDNYRSCTPEAKRNLIQTSALLSAGLGGGGVASAPGKRVTQTIHANASVGGSVVAGDMVVGSRGRKR